MAIDGPSMGLNGVSVRDGPFAWPACLVVYTPVQQAAPRKDSNYNRKKTRDTVFECLYRNNYQ